MQIECRISSLLEYYAEMQLILCKDIFFFRKMQGFIGKCLRVKEITEKAKKKGFFVVTIKIFMYFCKNKKPGVITSIE